MGHILKKKRKRILEPHEAQAIGKQTSHMLLVRV